MGPLFQQILKHFATERGTGLKSQVVVNIFNLALEVYRYGLVILGDATLYVAKVLESDVTVGGWPNIKDYHFVTELSTFPAVLMQQRKLDG